MKAAIVRGAGQAPIYGEIADPVAQAGEERIRVSAAALSPLTRARAAGTHYSSSGQFPFVAGIDGVGRLDDERLAYFVLPRSPYGGLAEQTVVPAQQCVPLPDGIDDTTAAAIANPGMSSWAALIERARFRRGETVLINGATGASGQLAVQIAKYMGAAKLIVTGRDERALATLASLGADVTIPLAADPNGLEDWFKEQFSQGVDVVLDYIWGPSAERLLAAAAKVSAEGVPLRYIQIGNASGAIISLPGAILRSSAIELMGSGIGSVPLPRLIAAIAGVFKAAAEKRLVLPTQTMPLAEVEQGWTLPSSERIVFVVN